MDDNEQTTPADSTGVAGPPPTAPLRRSTEDKVIAGVCGGLGRYFGVDPIWFRIAFVVLTFGGGSGILVYLLAWLLIPEQRAGETLGRGSSSMDGSIIVGVGLVAIGLMLLVNTLVPWFDRIMWPLIVIVAGLALLFTGTRRDRS